ncbi:glycosyltransferase family 2 protein [Trinickia fusca]|nr:glycosyltransferase family 2 protein [Trinickia fusca]
MTSVSVVIPTRNRPEKLQRCLTALARARGQIEFDVVVCDSTPDPDVRRKVAEVCSGFGFARLRFHDGNNVAAARNFCARSAETDLIVNVDDDIQVEPGAIQRLFDAYEAADGHRVVAGSVRWGERWSCPVVMRSIGYGRAAAPGESPDFLIGAFFIYARKLALAKPWNEGIRTSDDRFMGALWRSNGVRLLFEPSARAVHDPEHVKYGVEHQSSHIYVNLFDAVIANPRPLRALSYELLGFIWGAKGAIRSGPNLLRFFTAWGKGHRALLRDYRYLSRLVADRLPPP